jgi:hypothetical protein
MRSGAIGGCRNAGVLPYKAHTVSRLAPSARTIHDRVPHGTGNPRLHGQLCLNLKGNLVLRRA